MQKLAHMFVAALAVLTINSLFTATAVAGWFGGGCRRDGDDGTYRTDSQRYPVYRYERISPGGRPYAWSIVYYYPPSQNRYYGDGCYRPSRPTPVYTYERYSPAGYPYPSSRVDYFAR